MTAHLDARMKEGGGNPPKCKVHENEMDADAPLSRSDHNENLKAKFLCVRLNRHRIAYRIETTTPAAFRIVVRMNYRLGI